MDKAQVIISGSIAIDRIMTFSGKYSEVIDPTKLDVLSVSVLVDTTIIANGGIGANIAHNLAALGDKPILLGSVGSDASGYIAELNSRGIDTSQIFVSQLPTASFSVINDAQGNQVGGFYPGAMADSETLTFADRGDGVGLYWIAAHDPAAMKRQSAEAKKLSIKLAYDPGQQVNNVSGEDLKEGIEAAEILLLNEYELGILSSKTGLGLEDLRQQVPLVITTAGEKGSEIGGTSIKDPLQIPIAKPDKMVDPGGAGDAYRGGFIYGYLRQWDVKKCGQLGAVMASFVVEQHGPQIEFSIPSIKDRYKLTFNEELEL